MALWGTKDTVYSDGTIDISGTTVTGTGTTFNTSGVIAAGDVITVGTAASVGEAVVASVDSGTQITLYSSQFITYTGTITGQSYEIRQKPISTLEDTNYSAVEIFGVDTTEQGVVNALAGSNNKRKYAPPHAGWVGISSYTDMHGNFRVKTETLVASSSISADASDDEILADS